MPVRDTKTVNIQYNPPIPVDSNMHDDFKDQIKPLQLQITILNATSTKDLRESFKNKINNENPTNPSNSSNNNPQNSSYLQFQSTVNFWDPFDNDDSTYDLMAIFGILLLITLFLFIYQIYTIFVIFLVIDILAGSIYFYAKERSNIIVSLIIGAILPITGYLYSGYGIMLIIGTGMLSPFQILFACFESRRQYTYEYNNKSHLTVIQTAVENRDIAFFCGYIMMIICSIFGYYITITTINHMLNEYQCNCYDCGYAYCSRSNVGDICGTDYNGDIVYCTGGKYNETDRYLVTCLYIVIPVIDYLLIVIQFVCIIKMRLSKAILLGIPMFFTVFLFAWPGVIFFIIFILPLQFICGFCK